MCPEKNRCRTWPELAKNISHGRRHIPLTTPHRRVPHRTATWIWTATDGESRVLPKHWDAGKLYRAPSEAHCAGVAAEELPDVLRQWQWSRQALSRAPTTAAITKPRQPVARRRSEASGALRPEHGEIGPKCQERQQHCQKHESGQIRLTKWPRSISATKPTRTPGYATTA